MNKFGVMGNVNGREDGSTGGGEVDEDGGAPDEMGGAPPHGDGGELMGQSPPSSPRAAQSPLMFTPQVHFFPNSSSFFQYAYLGFSGSLLLAPDLGLELESCFLGFVKWDFLLSDSLVFRL